MLIMLIQGVILIASLGSPFFIFFDYSRKSQWKYAVYYLFAFFGFFVLSAFLIQNAGFGIVVYLPVIALLPFILLVLNRKKNH